MPVFKGLVFSENAEMRESLFFVYLNFFNLIFFIFNLYIYYIEGKQYEGSALKHR